MESETEEMDGLAYDSDATNMSVSVPSEIGSNSAVDIEGSSTDSEIDEIESGSPVLGDRILQDGIMLSQRTPVDVQPSRERPSTPAFVVESDSETDDDLMEDAVDRYIRGFTSGRSDTPSTSIRPNGPHAPLASSDAPAGRTDNVSSISTQHVSPNSDQPASEIADSMGQQSVVQSEETNSRPNSPQEQAGTSTRSSPLPDQSTSDVRSPSSNVPENVVGSEISAVDGDSEDRVALSVASTSTAVLPPQVVTTEALPSPESDEDEGQICSICFEAWTNSGEHRLASLKCGHIFGKTCIEKWLTGRGGKCPQCNSKAQRKDIRVLYAKSLKVLDTSEKDRALRELEQEKIAKRKLEIEHARTKLQYDLKSKLVTELQKELERLKKSSAEIGTAMTGGVNLGQGIGSAVTNRSLVIYTGSAIEIHKEGGTRVMAYNDWLNMLVVSMPCQVNMFPGFGFRKINVSDIKAEKYIPIHQKQIRDLAFNPAKKDLLLSVGIDRLVKLTNAHSNAVVCSFTAEAPLWSCCWNTDQANQFFVGTASGSVIIYDTRNTASSVKTIKVSGSGPVVSMCYVPYKANASFCTGGLLVARLSSCSFVELKEDDFKTHTLPLEGPFTCVSFEEKSRHLLVSCRPSAKNPHTRHLVCEPQMVNLSNDETNPNQVVTVNTVQVFLGGTTMKVLSRSIIFEHPFKPMNILVCASDESTRHIYLWDISTGKCVQRLTCSETVIDIVQVKNNQSYLVLLTDKYAKFYKWVDYL